MSEDGWDRVSLLFDTRVRHLSSGLRVSWLSRREGPRGAHDYADSRRPSYRRQGVDDTGRTVFGTFLLSSGFSVAGPDHDSYHGSFSDLGCLVVGDILSPLTPSRLLVP